MNERKYKVPEGMVKAFETGYYAPMRSPEENDPSQKTLRGLEGAIKWLAENPISPTLEQGKELLKITRNVYGMCEEWQRHMFLSLEPEEPAEITDLLVAESVGRGNMWNGDEFNKAVREAYSRGQQSRVQNLESKVD